MTLFKKIQSDMVVAMKNQNKFDLSVLRMLKSALQLESIKLKHDLTDEETMIVIKKQVKVRKDSIDEYKSYNKNDLVENLEKEVEILSNYLPEEMSTEQINAILDKAFDEIKPTSIKDMGTIMKAITPIIGVQADMKLVSSLIREKLQ